MVSSSWSLLRWSGKQRWAQRFCKAVTSPERVLKYTRSWPRIMRFLREWSTSQDQSRMYQQFWIRGVSRSAIIEFEPLGESVASLLAAANFLTTGDIGKSATLLDIFIPKILPEHGRPLYQPSQTSRLLLTQPYQCRSGGAKPRRNSALGRVCLMANFGAGRKSLAFIAPCGDRREPVKGPPLLHQNRYSHARRIRTAGHLNQAVRGTVEEASLTMTPRSANSMS